MEDSGRKCSGLFAGEELAFALPFRAHEQEETRDESPRRNNAFAAAPSASEKRPESMGARQREIAVSRVLSKETRHLLGFDSPRRALLTAVKEAVDNSMDACEEAGIVPEISIELEQTADTRFRVTVTDNGPGIVKAQIPRSLPELSTAPSFIASACPADSRASASTRRACMANSTGSATQITSRTKGSKVAHSIAVQIDTKDE
ncbi:MAG: ATP-binding protein [Kiritimatiellae bacterium]|nr:ATP-binding protein [Kiritimatiellia bacterium]